MKIIVGVLGSLKGYQTVEKIIKYFSALISGLSIVISVNAECNANLVVSKPNDIYVNHGDGTVTDLETGLMWGRCLLGTVAPSPECDTSPAHYDWGEALQRVQQANQDGYLGYSDWRLPNIKELNSLVQLECDSTFFNENIFQFSATRHWSSTPRSEEPFNAAWNLSTVALGSISHSAKTLPGVVMVVRSTYDIN